MSAAEDQIKRDMAGRARLALDALEVAIWNRSVEILKTAENLSNNGTLTAERSHTLLISLIEQRRIDSGLKSQVSEGVKAVRRMNTQLDLVESKKQTETAARKQGRNRFVRSKAG